MVDNPTGTPPEGKKPTDTAPTDAPKTKWLEVSDQTRYEIPNDLEIPEIIVKGLKEKDKTIKETKDRIAALEAQAKTNQEWNERVSSFLRQGEEDKGRPDPYENPDQFQRWLADTTKKELAEDSRRRNLLLTNTNSELMQLHKLTGGDREKMDRVIQYMKDSGFGVIRDGDETHLQSGSSEAAYKATFHDELVEQVKQSVRDEMKAEMEKMQQTAISVPEGPVFDAEGRTWSELTPIERHKRLKEDDAPFGRGRKPSSYLQGNK